MAFQGSVWAAIFKQNGPFIEICQLNNGTVPLADSEATNLTDQDLDGVDYLHDPFEFSAENDFPLEAGGQTLLEFNPIQSPYPGTILDTGLMGAALDGVIPNQDARTAEEDFVPDQQRDGLYDLGGNVIPGGNAPIFQIKKVAGGTVVGNASIARDAMHVGIRPRASVQTLVASDATLALAFNHIDQNPKISAIEIVEIGSPSDTQTPLVESITVENPSDNDRPIQATPEATLLDGSDVAIGGLRAAATPGFVTAGAEPLPAAVLTNLTDPATPTAVGVTSNDYLTMASFEARWECLNVTSV
ncbi:hypothetical protein [Halomonas sp. M20]|uniref:hypothetical protein n=1 Tax=Halomonas sp. M20 TaxID=2763264 RepID=UPI001D0B1C7A|nr:hypothetical protein [Halomonas sp. M20]